MDLNLVTLLSILVGAAPIMVSSYFAIRKWGFGLWLFSPLPAYLFAYLMAFGFVPYIEINYGFRIYQTVSFDQDAYVQAEIWGALANYGFALGYALPRHKRRSVPLPDSTPSNADAQQKSQRRIAARSQNMAFAIAIVLQLIFVAFLFSIHVITLNFGQNRTIYLNSMFNAGYITLINGLSQNLVMVGLLFCIWSRRLGILGIISSLLFLIPNILITTRAAITALLFLALFSYAIRMYRLHGKIHVGKMLAAVGLIVIFGALIGLSREAGNDATGAPADTVVKSDAALPPALNALIFLSYTFDMEVTLQQSIRNTTDHEFGFSWLEDGVYTFLPRIFFPDKPINYGTNRLQVKIAPDITGGELLTNASYPMGIYGEAYINFGFPGIIITLIVLGAMLKFAFNACIDLAYSHGVRWKSIWALVIYATLCSNALGYIRGFGLFLASVAFFGTLLWALLMAIRSAGNPTLAQRTPKTESSAQ